MRRLLIIVALLITVPIVEIAVLIAIGRVIGLGWTLVLMLATSALGGWLLRREGGRAWRAFQTDLAEGRPPGPAATDGMLVLLGGVFMLIPGFVSDLIGALFLIPPTRRVARGLALGVLASRISSPAAMTLFGPRRVRVRQPYGPPPGPRTGPSSAPGGRRPAEDPGGSREEVIEGEIIDPG